MTAPDDNVVAVIFRMEHEPAGVLAVFPYEAGDYDGAPAGISERDGSCSPSPIYLHEKTRPATPEEYASLKRTLESAPYNYKLRVLQRMPRDATSVRRSQIRTYAKG